MSITTRNMIDEKDKWDLSTLFKDEKEWENALSLSQSYIEEAPEKKGTLLAGKESMLKTLRWLTRFEILVERVATYAMLRYSADSTDETNTRLYGLAMNMFTGFGSALAWYTPELLSIPEETFNGYLKDPDFKEWHIALAKERRHKPHVLSEPEERILALQSESGTTAYQAFESLNNADMQFGEIDGKPLTHASYHTFMISADRELRKRAYDQLYGVFDQHKHTLSQLYKGSVTQDIFSAKVRGYSSSLESSLFSDNVDKSVYTTLIEKVHGGLDSLHRFYELKRQKLGVEKLAHWDVYVPLVEGIDSRHSYEEALDITAEALKPLGNDYCEIYRSGLGEKRWVDRYESRGKRSGAFSSGCYTSAPYILLNFTGNSISDLFTIIHEGGHSMHSYFSKRHNPFSCYDYTIFEAEVASTFNEQLLAHHLLKKAEDKKTRQYLIAKQLDDITATLFRQTMFAEFELLIHQKAEAGEPVTLPVIRKTYRDLLELYFGENVELSELSDLEALRIPHFYSAFYVYKYATGISAAIALSEMVLEGKEAERDRYLSFLRSGGSRFPMDSLKLAGVNMSDGKAVERAIGRFSQLLDQLERSYS